MKSRTPTIVLMYMVIVAAASGACRMEDRTTKLWEIGQADGTTAGMALAPARWKEFRDDAFFVVGLSDPAKDWPCIHPGPYNAWGASRQHTYSIYFLLADTIKAGQARLTIDLAETHWDLPSRLRVAVNDQVSEHQLPVGGSDAVLEGDFSQAKPHRIVLAVPASALKQGPNQVDITSVTGSWCLYDRILFEAPPRTSLVRPESFTALEVRPQPAILEREGQRLQSLAVVLKHAGSETAATLDVPDAEQLRIHLQPGVQRLDRSSDHRLMLSLAKHRPYVQFQFPGPGYRSRSSRARV